VDMDDIDIQGTAHHPQHYPWGLRPPFLTFGGLRANDPQDVDPYLKGTPAADPAAAKGFDGPKIA